MLFSTLLILPFVVVGGFGIAPVANFVVANFVIANFVVASLVCSCVARTDKSVMNIRQEKEVLELNISLFCWKRLALVVGVWVWKISLMVNVRVSGEGDGVWYQSMGGGQTN